jgi:hypothetical protein
VQSSANKQGLAFVENIDPKIDPIFGGVREHSWFLFSCPDSLRGPVCQITLALIAIKNILLCSPEILLKALPLPLPALSASTALQSHGLIL